MAEEAQVKKRKPNWTQEETLHLVYRIQERELVINGRFEPSLTNKDKGSPEDPPPLINSSLTTSSHGRLG